MIKNLHRINESDKELVAGLKHESTEFFSKKSCQKIKVKKNVSINVFV